MDDQLRLTRLEVAREAVFIEQVKTALGLAADAQLELSDSAQTEQGERLVSYTVKVAVKLDNAELGVASGVVVDESTQVSLRFDQCGGLVSSQVGTFDERHLRQVQDQVRKLVATNAIYMPAPNERIDLDVLRAQRKAWYIAIDAQGHKRLKRAFMS